MTAPASRPAVVVDDDPDIRDLVTAVLTDSGFDVRSASNGRDGVALVRDHAPIITTLDVQMDGGMDGFATAKQIREFSNTYIVMITGRGDEYDVVDGLHAGADDYLTKPFSPRELRARVEALLRRPRAMTPGNGTAPAVVVERNGLSVDPEERAVRVDGVPVELTRSEFDLLWALVESGRRIRSKTDLARVLRQDDVGWVSESDERAIEVHVANLRRKLGDSSTSPRWVETVRGVGYRLASA